MGLTHESICAMKPSEIRELYDIEQVAEKYGMKIGGAASRYAVCLLPVHPHTIGKKRTESLSFYEYKGVQMFKCHGICGKTGDVIDLVGYMTISGYNPKDFEMRLQAADNLRGNPIALDQPRREQKIYLLPDFIWKEFLPISQQVLDYLIVERGFTEDEVTKWRFGSTSHLDKEHHRPVKGGMECILSIPTFHLGTTVAVKLRRISAGHKFRYFTVPGSKGGLWNYDAVAGTTEPVLISKGELCGALMARHFLACAMTSGEAGMKSQSTLFTMVRGALMNAQKVYVGDNDAAGRKHGPMRAALFDAVLKYPDERYKDWDSWYLARPDDCLRQTERWMEEVS